DNLSAVAAFRSATARAADRATSAKPEAIQKVILLDNLSAVAAFRSATARAADRATSAKPEAIQKVIL
ncbi:hypothetical protein C0U44_32735, partial [Klebsiella pneumoniae]